MEKSQIRDKHPGSATLLKYAALWQRSLEVAKSTTEGDFWSQIHVRKQCRFTASKVNAGENSDDQRHLNGKQAKRTLDVVTAIAAGRRATCRNLATAQGAS